MRDMKPPSFTLPRRAASAEAVGGWPSVVAVASAAAVAVSVYGDLDNPLRPVLVLSFLLAGPGTPLVRLLHLADPLAEAVIAVGLSLAIATLVSVGLLFAGAPSPSLALAVLIGITLTGAVADLAPTRYGGPGARDSR